MEVYGQDPAAAARGFAAQGAKYLHVVDLDGAKDGALSNFDTAVSYTHLVCGVSGDSLKGAGPFH